MKKPVSNMAASVRARLLQLAHSSNRTNNEILDRFCAERFLYRLSQSKYRQLYVLKGAMLFTAWGGGLAHRVTRDTDLLGSGASDYDAVRKVFRDICETPVADDGVRFDSKSIRTDRIRALEEYEGVRVLMTALLGSARIQVQVDVGFGDIFAPTEHEFPSLLEFPRPVLQMYTKDYVVAEKFEAMVKLGMLNTRLKDYFDIWYLSRSSDFNGTSLLSAITKTFKRRNIALPASIPEGLSREFSADPQRQKQWKAFWNKSVKQADPPDLPEVVTKVAAFVGPVLEGKPRQWTAGGSWS